MSQFKKKLKINLDIFHKKYYSTVTFNKVIINILNSILKRF